MMSYFLLDRFIGSSLFQLALSKIILVDPTQSSEKVIFRQWYLSQYGASFTTSNKALKPISKDVPFFRKVAQYIHAASWINTILIVPQLVLFIALQ